MMTRRFVPVFSGRLRWRGHRRVASTRFCQPSHGEAQCNHSPGTRLAFNFNPSMVLLNNLLAGWQSQSCSHANTFRCKPQVEYLLNVFRGNTPP